MPQHPNQTDRPGQRSLLQIDHPKLVHLALAFCFALCLAGQTRSTYTGSFIDHKSLLNTPKQLITNTLKQIKPKFNPRSSFNANDKQQKLNVYDLSSEGKTVRKQSSKEQLPQGTYYYTDYKPLVKHLIPMSPLCPETGRTVCKDIKAYPIDSILNLILEAKANKFNFSSLFVDESQNSEMPNFNDPELDSTVAKCGGSGGGPDDKSTPDYDKDEHSYRTTTNAPSPKGYEGVKGARDYKRPGSSTVYYDNENYSNGEESPNPAPNYNSGFENENKNYDGNSYDKPYEQQNKPYDNKPYEQQQKINENANSYNPHVPKVYPSSKPKAPREPSVVEAHPAEPASNPVEPYNRQQPIEQYNHQPVEQYQQYKEPIQQKIQQKQNYQQPQSSIKYEQQEQHSGRPQPPSAYRSVQDLNYRTSNQNAYYQTRKTPANRRPFRTTITIIPFIQYISQLPTNEYQISNSDKQLLDTISQSLRNAPVLNGLTPDAWLPIKAYTTDDIAPSKEMVDHLSTQRIGSDELSSDHLAAERLSDGADEDVLRSDYTTNYRDKRSACSEEAAGETSKRKASSGRTDGAERRADENSSITRVKKQAGFDEEPEELCQTKRLYITPKAALNDRSEWRYIVNVGERDSRLKQVISVSVCASPNGPCSSQISLPFGYVSRCKQKYIKKKLLAIDPDGQSTSTENFFIPSCCVCEINRVNQG